MQKRHGVPGQRWFTPPIDPAPITQILIISPSVAVA